MEVERGKQKSGKSTVPFSLLRVSGLSKLVFFIGRSEQLFFMFSGISKGKPGKIVSRDFFLSSVCKEKLCLSSAASEDRLDLTIDMFVAMFEKEERGLPCSEDCDFLETSLSTEIMILFLGVGSVSPLISPIDEGKGVVPALLSSRNEE